jgi:hypothetical protein
MMVLNLYLLQIVLLFAGIIESIFIIVLIKVKGRRNEIENKLLERIGKAEIMIRRYSERGKKGERRWRRE